MAKEKIKTQRSSADKAVNAVIAVVLVVVIALASVALYDKFRPRDKVKDMAETQGMSVEDFMAEYGIEGATASTKMEDVYENMTIENVLKLNGMTFEEFASSSQLPETVTPDMNVSEFNKILEEMNAATEQENAEAAAEGEEAPAEGEEAPAEGEAASAE